MPGALPAQIICAGYSWSLEIHPPHLHANPFTPFLSLLKFTFSKPSGSCSVLFEVAIPVTLSVLLIPFMLPYFPL